MTSEPSAEEREAELAKVWKRLSRAARRGDLARFEELKVEHDRLKAEHVTRSHEEQRVAARVRRAAERAEAVSVASRRWRPPRGFGISPLAAERARSGWQERREPVRPARGLRPWRQGSPMQERIWRP